ncbi:MAG: hypothetical protein ACE5FQ_03140 [Thiogranum sp.]
MHLLVAITAHGFGHAAQAAPLVNALQERFPALQVTLLSSLPGSFLKERIRGRFRQIKRAPDFGLVMHSALAIDLDASAAAYAGLHADWQQRVDEEARQLEALAPDLVLADVPYLTLAAATRAGIPAVALCSLNWADVYRHYFRHREEAPRVLAQMESAYRGAHAFLCPEPSMPMQFLDNRLPVGPIAVQGRQLRDELIRELGLHPECALVLVAPGGVATRFAMEDWPQGQAVHWLVSECWQVYHPDVSPFEHTGLDFPDLVRSCDAVLGKCGYGTVAECVLNGTPLLYIPRPDWPEEQSLLHWLDAHGAAIELEPRLLVTGELKALVEQARAATVESPAATGIGQAADYLSGLLA